MMIRTLYSIVLFLGLTAFVSGQNLVIRTMPEVLGSDITSEDVLLLKQLYHHGEAEECLKKGLEILSSKAELSATDSFYTYQSLAYTYFELNAYKPALAHVNYSEAIVQRNALEVDLMLSSWITQFFNAVDDYKTTIQYYQRDIEVLERSSDTFDLLKAYNNLGHAYYLDKQPSLAALNYNKIINFGGQQEKYALILGIASGNSGVLHFEAGEYETALELFKINAELCKQTYWPSHYRAMNRVGECYILMEEPALAIQVLLELSALDIEDGPSLLKMYQQLATAHNNSGNHAESAYYLRRTIAASDSIELLAIPKEDILEQLSNYKVDAINADLDFAKKELELLDAEMLSAALKSRVYLITLILSFATIVMAILYFRNRQKKNRAIHELENELLESELKNKRTDLKNFSTNLSYKRKFITEVQAKLKELEHGPDEQLKQNVSLLIREFNNYERVNKSGEVLQSDVDNVNSSFFKKLGAQFPLLTENEKELCGLLMLKMSSKDIANLRNVTPNAIKKARQRIRKKLPIDEAKEISTFLEQI
jgi:DNA-binding CsgD family transcriptional regulator